MKLIYFRRVLCAGFLCLSDGVVAGNLIYGLDNAATLHSSQGGLIQVASFQHQSYALRYQHQIQSFTSYPVRIVHKANNYKVILGPIPTSLERQKTARAILNKLHRTPPKASKPIMPQSTPRTSKSVKNPVKSYGKLVEKDAFVNQAAHANWFLAAGSGAQFSQTKSRMTVSNGSRFAPPNDVDVYSSHHHDTNALFLLSAGRRWTLERPWIPAYSLGLYYQYLSPFKTRGTITQYSEPEFTNYNYQFNASSNVLLASAKVNLYRMYSLSPYVTAGLGVAFNRFSGYQEEALPNVTPRISPAFGSNSSSQFAYNAGAGFDVQMSRSMFVSIGYLYQSIGPVSSGQGKTTWSTTSLNLGTAAQNEVVASVNYLIDG